MEKEKSRFIKYPNEGELLSPNDALVYVALRSYMNNETLECYPSIDTICEDSKLSRVTVSNSLKKLVDKGYITRRRDGNKMIYKFNEENRFEPFSYEFLKKEDLTPTEKGVLILCQKHMIKEAGYGDIYYSNRELEKLIDVSRSTLNRVFNSLKKKGYLSMGNIVRADKTLTKAKQFNLTELEQAIVFKLAEHDERIEEHDERIEENSENIETLQNEVTELKEEIRLLKKQLKLKNKLEESSRLEEEEMYRIRHGE